MTYSKFRFAQILFHSNARKWTCRKLSIVNSKSWASDRFVQHHIIKQIYRIEIELLYSIGETEKREFQAETRMLLDIVAKSLYSDKEVWFRIDLVYLFIMLKVFQIVINFVSLKRSSLESWYQMQAMLWKNYVIYPSPKIQIKTLVVWKYVCRPISIIEY